MHSSCLWSYIREQNNPDFYFGEKSTHYIIPDSDKKDVIKRLKSGKKIECDSGDGDNLDRRARENLALWKPKKMSKLVMHRSIHDWNKEYSRQKESKWKDCKAEIGPACLRNSKKSVWQEKL